MKRLICSAAVASVLLGASVIPSGASTVIPTDASFTETVATPFAVSNGFDLTSTETVNIAGSTAIPVFTVTLTEPTPPPVAISVISGVWNETFTLAAGAYSLMFAGTAPVGTSGYTGQITIGAVSTTPIPGALALFASGLGLLGFWGLTKGRKASPEATAC
jgi:hypothetical protein